jgi:hypothetical protein
MLDRLYLLQELDRRVRLPGEAVAKAEALYEKLIALLVQEMPLADARALGEGPRAALRDFIADGLPAAEIKRILKRWDPHLALGKDATELHMRRFLAELLEGRREPSAKPPKPPRRTKAAPPPAAKPRLLASLFRRG